MRQEIRSTASLDTFDPAKDHVEVDVYEMRLAVDPAFRPDHTDPEADPPMVEVEVLAETMEYRPEQRETVASFRQRVKEGIAMRAEPPQMTSKTEPSADVALTEI